LLVCGAAINTLLLACSGKRPSICQPVSFNQVSERRLKKGLTQGVVKMVRCMGSTVSPIANCQFPIAGHRNQHSAGV